MSFTDFRAMPIWQKGLHLLLHVYQITKRFPPEEQFGITSDLRSSANSVIHNFAKGFGSLNPNLRLSLSLSLGFIQSYF